MPRSGLKHLILFELERQAPIIFNKLMVEQGLLSSGSAQEETKKKEGDKCNNCASILQEIRYKCSVCQNYTICQVCEDTVDHPHPMLKLKPNHIEPSKIPQSITQSINAQPVSNKSDKGSASGKARDGAVDWKNMVGSFYDRNYDNSNQWAF